MSDTENPSGDDILEGVDLNAAPAEPTEPTEPPAEETPTEPPAEETPEEVPAEETPAEETPTETPADPEPAPDPVQPEQPAPSETEKLRQAAYDKRQAAVNDYNKARAAIDSMADDDMPTAGMLKAQHKAEADWNAANAEFQKLDAVYQQEQAQRVEQANTAWYAAQSKAIGLPATELRKIYDAEYKALAAEFPGADVGIAAVIQMKAKAKAIIAGKAGQQVRQANKPAKPVTPGGAKVTPKGAVTRPPAPKAKTPEEKFDEKFAKDIDALLE